MSDNKVKIKWKETKGPDGKFAVMKECEFIHHNGFTWGFVISTTADDKFFIHSDHLGFKCQSIGSHKTWPDAQKMALKIGTLLFQKMMVDCENASSEIDEELERLAKQQIEKRGYSNIDLLDVGDYVKTKHDRTGWVIDMQKFSQDSPMAHPGSITVVFDDSSTEENFEHWNWPDLFEVIPNPYNSGASTHH